jgi:pyruvate kinase
LEHLDEILDACDLVMIARGDLGLEMPLERVPRAQKHITVSARRRQIPVILATQVLESMTTEARPTRAEVSDAANAVDDGVDAIMLAGETAIGVSPDRAVRTLDAIIRDAESGPAAYVPVAFVPDPTTAHEQAICDAAVTLAEHGNCQAIVAITKGGTTARRLSARRPRVPIFATTGREEIARRMTPLWGVIPVCAEISGDFNAAGLFVTRQLVARGLVPKGAAVVLVSIDTDLTRTESNYLKIQRV